MKHYYLNFFLVLAVVLSSCAYRNASYFQGLDRNANISHKIDNYAPLTIQAGDILALHVKSLSPEGSAIFNTDVSDSAPSGNAANSSSSSGSSSSGGGASGYLVNQQGEIELPLIHNIKVIGMTIEEVQNTLQKAVLPFLKEPIITVHIMNFKITVLGDVTNPNMYTINNEHISIPQALSLAGDLTITGKRENILLIREINGERKFVNIDITSDKLFDSPFYYLKNNDILYVEAGKGKYESLNQNYKTLPLITSILSVILIGYEIIRNR